MKDYQAKGLFGPRHVHKKILDIFFPKFDIKEKCHKQIAAKGMVLHNLAEAYLNQHPPQKELTPVHLGRLRADLKKHLAAEMVEIDKLVKKIIR